MRLTFLGTRGLVESRCDRHRRHASMTVSYRGRTVMVDCGTDWENEVRALDPGAIVLTHAHLNCAGGLRQAPCPVHASRRAWELLRDKGVERGRVIRHRRPANIQGMIFEAFPVDHSVDAPTVGYRITTGGIRIFYAPDVAHIHYRHEALRNVDLYIGDGSILDDCFPPRPMKRRAVASVPTQLTWCRKEGIPRAIITHCGMDIVEGDPGRVNERLRAQGKDRGVEARLAHDGLEVVLRPRRV